MIIPVRCFTCGKVVGSSYQTFVKRVQMGENPQEVLDEIQQDPDISNVKVVRL